MRRSKVTGTSEASQRGAQYAILWGGSAWTAENSDFDQALAIDMGAIKNVTGIATPNFYRDNAVSSPALTVSHFFNQIGT